ncbi:rhomboid family intramembrane serine protease [Variovorax robiniae]|uniref:Rhomboid family intramembrane serine protease n=1 Tax=Variovorax robiniae TaxID=1836199 RepID=A0ABU8X842_9BURK
MRQVVEGVEEFRASWRSSVGALLVFLCLIAIGLGWIAVSTGAYGWSVGAIALAWVVWLLGRQLRGARVVLRVEPRGLGGYWLKDLLVPWSEIADLREESVQGNSQLVMQLLPGAASAQPTARWLSGRKLERRLPLGALTATERRAAVEAALRAFLRHGGANAAVAAQAHIEAHAAEAQFDARLKAMTPMPWALYLMVALNVGVWVANVLTGMSPVAPLSEDLFRWGANSAWAVTQDGQFWRLLSAAFLHGGVMHLALNMLGLWSAGLVLNRLYGNRQFLLIYLGSAMAGNALSLHFSAQQSVSVGASGAVFGVLGALIVAVLQHGHRLPAGTRKSLLSTQAIFVVYSLVQGFARAGVDNAAHVGGLIAGSVLAWLLVERLDDEATAAKRLRHGILAACLWVTGMGWLVATTAQPAVDHGRGFQVQANLQKNVGALQQANLALQKDAKANQGGQMSDALMIAALRDRHIPAIRTVRDALASLSLPASDPRFALLSDFQQLSALMVEVMELEVRKGEGDATPELAARIRTRSEEMKKVSERMKARASKKSTES